MSYALIINAAISLIMGSALILVWQRDRTQIFTHFIGWANLIQLAVPVSYWLTTQSHSAVSVLGLAMLPVVAASYTSLLMVGASHLARRPMPPKRGWVVWVFLIVLNAAALGVGGLPMGQTSVATINTVLGLVCTYWLWGTLGPRLTPEKLVGVLLIALGLIQYIYVVYHDDGAALLATLGAILRLSLGLVLLYAALDRSALATRKQKNRFESLAQRSHQGILISQGAQGIVYANPASLAVYGVDTLDRLRVVTVDQAIPLEEREKVVRIIDAVQRGHQTDASYEAQRFRADGTPLWLRFHYFQTEWDGEPAVQILISDYTERQQASQALIHQATHDELTGLPNRTALIQGLGARCKPNHPAGRFVLLLMNIDRFKLFNDAHGHFMGDEVLRAFARALRMSVDARCEVMRLGGDEFAIVSSPDGDAQAGSALVASVQQLLKKPLRVAGQEVFLDASLGVALYPTSAGDANALLRAANAAMHVAKRTPGTSYQFAEKEFEQGSSNALAQEQALRAGLERGELHLVYQPKVDAQTGALTSFEALARWNRPEVGPVSPVEFIAAAERTGLIGALGKELLKQACQQIAAWRSQYGCCVPVAVNVSPLQMLDPHFPQLVAQLLADHGVPSEWLTLEITESSAVHNLDQTVLQVEELRAMGVHVAMDDFGTGFSSLNMLRQLRLHTVKIDRGLIDPLPAPDAVAVVRAICQLANALHLHVVAEGVETREQADAARDAGCGDLQGYLFSKPLQAKDVGPWLEPLAQHGTASEWTVQSASR